MKVAVLGAGVIGVTSAWYLAEAGHEVVVVDRREKPGMETSFANAGEISPGYSSPWAGPGVPLKAIRWLLMRHGPLVLSSNIAQVDIHAEQVAALPGDEQDVAAGRHFDAEAAGIEVGDLERVARAGPDDPDDLAARLVLELVDQPLSAGGEVGGVLRQVFLMDDLGLLDRVLDVTLQPLEPGQQPAEAEPVLLREFALGDRDEAGAVPLLRLRRHDPGDQEGRRRAEGHRPPKPCLQRRALQHPLHLFCKWLGQLCLPRRFPDAGPGINGHSSS